MYPTISLNHASIFTSGLNRNLSAKCLNVDTKIFENQLKDQNIDANFNNNKPIAFCLNLIDTIFKQLNFTHFIFIFPRFRVFNKEELAINTTKSAFCIPESQLILKNEMQFETGSIFQEQVSNIEELDNLIETDYKNGKRSSGHFLADTMHEIMHSIYIDKIYKKYGYNGKCPYTKNKYFNPNTLNNGLQIMENLQVQTLSTKENKLVNCILGKYSTNSLNQYHEIFAEFFTKLICDTLSEKNGLPTKDPKDELKKYPKEFLSILAKILNI